MKTRFLLFLMLLCSLPYVSQAQMASCTAPTASFPTGVAVNITDTGLTNIAGAPLPSGCECFTPVNNQRVAIAAQYPGGTVSKATICSPVTNGVMTAIQLVKSNVTNPVNLCYQRTVIDLSTGNYVISQQDGFGCVQVSADTNMNTVPPSTTGLQLAVVGPQGPAATVAVGTVNTGAPGSSAAVSNAGTSTAAVLNFTVPQGPQGIVGPVGPVGPVAAFMGAYSSTTTYNTGQAVSSGGTSYISLVASNLNNPPATSLTQWAVLAAAGVSGVQVAQGVNLREVALPQSRNILDPTRVTVPGSSVSITTGALLAQSGWCATGFMGVVGGQSYVANVSTVVNSAAGWAFYDITQTFVSGSLGTAAGTAVVAPSTAIYARASWNCTTQPIASTNIIFTQGTTLPTYTDFAPVGAMVAGNIASTAATTAQAGAVTQSSALREAALSQQRNIFDQTRIFSGMLITGATGATSTVGAPWYSTPYMAVVGGASYVSNAPIQAGTGGSGYAWYDVNKVFISGVAGAVTAGTAITAPANAYYLRASLISTSSPVTGVTFTQGTTLPTYTDFAPVGPVQSASIAQGVANTVATSLANYEIARATTTGSVTLNLFNSAQTFVGGLINSNGTLLTADGTTGFQTIGYVPIYGVTSLVANATTSFSGANFWAFYDINKVFISSTIGVAAGTPVTVPAGAYYVNTAFGPGTTAAVNMPNFTANFMLLAATTMPSQYILNSVGFTTPTGGYILSANAAPNSALNLEIANRNASVLIPTHWKGQRLCTIGDSFDFYGSNASRGGGFQYAIANQLGMTLTIDNGVVGEQLAQIFTASAYTSVTNSTTIQNCDLEVIELGTNDYGNAPTVPVGLVTDTTNASYYGSIYLAINTMLTWKPTLKIIFISPWYRGTDATHPLPPPANSAGNVVADYVTALLTLCPQYGIPVIDVYHKAGVNALNLESVTFDGFLHPSATGYTNFYNPVVVGEIAKY